MNFNQQQIELMDLLGYSSDFEKDMCYEGFQEDQCEMRANGIPTNCNFTQWLERRVSWERTRKIQMA